MTLADRLVDEILDRVIHRAHRIELTGERLRKRQSGAGPTGRLDGRQAEMRPAQPSVVADRHPVMLSAAPSSGMVNTMITITRIGDHDRPEWLISWAARWKFRL
jgi:hypothetical protein